MPPPPQQPQNPYGDGPPAAPGPYGGQPPYGTQPPAAPGPYGAAQPSAAPGPYGAQQPPQAPGPYGAPFPQQPAPPYGANPQQPYPAWGGGPMMPPAPPKRRTGLILGIVGGVVVLVVLGLVGLAVLGAKATSGFPEAKMMLTLPKTLVDGKYEMTEDLSDSEGKKIEDEADGAWDAKVTDALVARYSLGGDETKGTLVVSGMYGRFKNTDEARDNMLSGAAKSENAQLAVPPRDFDLGVTISCEVVTQTQLGTKITVPVCGWCDDNTGASVAEVTVASMTQNPADVDLEQAARNTLKVRSEMIKAIG